MIKPIIFGWYLKNQYYNDYDPNGNCYEGWYQDGETCNYGIYENDVLVTPIPYVIPSESWCSFLKKYDWVTDCRLYYNVKQKKTFDEVVIDKLSGTENADERVEYYNLLARNDTATMYGNHQTLRNMLSENSNWNNKSDGLYQKIQLYYFFIFGEFVQQNRVHNFNFHIKFCIFCTVIIFVKNNFFVVIFYLTVKQCK